MKLTKTELETQINFNEEDGTASIETPNRALIHNLDKLCQKSKEITCVRRFENFKTYICPKKWIKVRAPKKISDEKRSELAEKAKERFTKSNSL